MPATVLAAMLSVGLVGIVAPGSLDGQSSGHPASAGASHAGSGKVVAHRKTKKQIAAEKAAAELAAAEQAAEAQKAAQAPSAPNWPVNDKAVPAAVDWNGKDLSISAMNASLAQILHDVSIATGLKVEGLGADQRVFGSYGPAGARDVIARLMEGSGYNVLIIGDRGEGTPRQLVLTAKAKGVTATHGADGQPNPNGDDEAVEEPEQPEMQPDPVQRRQFNGAPQPGVAGQPGQPGQGARTPQQMMEELQQRQQQQMGNPNPGVPAPQ